MNYKFYSMKKLFTCLSFALLTAGAAQAQLQNYSVGQTAPDFTVTDLHGHEHQLSDYSGKWVIIDFFAYWCGPCAQIAPTINEFYRKYGCNNYDIIVLGLEGDGTTAQTQAFEDANGGDPNYPTPTVSGLDGGADPVHNTYGPAAYPTIVLIGPDGQFKNIDIWPISSIATLESAVSSAGGSSALVPHTCALGVDELTVDASAAYPNPTTGDATIAVNMPNQGTVDVVVYSVTGEQLSSTSFEVAGGTTELPVALSSYASGTYFVRLSNGESVSSMIPVVKR